MLKLRPYKKCDADKIAGWIKTERMMRAWSTNRYASYPITGADINAYYAGFDDTDRFFAMTAFDETGPVGHFGMRFEDETQKSVRISYVVVDADKRGMGCGRQMLTMAVDYAFRFLHAQAVTLGVFENNPAARRCYEAVGFTRSQTRKDQYFTVMGEQWLCLEMEYKMNA